MEEFTYLEPSRWNGTSRLARLPRSSCFGLPVQRPARRPLAGTLQGLRTCLTLFQGAKLSSAGVWARQVVVDPNTSFDRQAALSFLL